MCSHSTYIVHTCWDLHVGLTSFSCAHARVIGYRWSLLTMQCALYSRVQGGTVNKGWRERQKRFTSVVNTVEIAALSLHCVYSQHVFTECVCKGLQ